MTADPSSVGGDEGCQRLWSAVILRSIQDALLEEQPKGSKLKWDTRAVSGPANIPVLRDRARFWLLEAQRDYVEVCCLAGIVPEVLRDAVRRMLRDETSIAAARAVFFTAKPEAASSALRSVLGSGLVQPSRVAPQGNSGAALPDALGA